jgi:hypothetical protein
VSVNAQKMNDVLDLDDTMTDLSSTGKMRDVYPIAIFRLEHVLTLFENQLFGEAFYILPWALLFRGVLSDKLDVPSRIYTLEQALLIFAFFEQSYQAGKKGNRRNALFFSPRVGFPREARLPEQGSAGVHVTPLKRTPQIRVLATTATLIAALRTIECDIPLDRIGTDPLENFFGLLRRLLHDCNMFAEVRHAIARNCAVHRVMDELGHPRNIRGRANTGGIVSRRTGGTPCRCEDRLPSELSEGFLACFGMPDILDREGDEMKVMRLLMHLSGLRIFMPRP